MTIDKDKIGRLLILIGAVGLIVGLIAFLATRGQDVTSQDETPQNAYQEVPEAEVNSIQGSKSAAYRDHREAKEDSPIENYWDSCMEEEDSSANEQTGQPQVNPSSAQQPKTSTELFRGGSSHSPAPRSSSGYTNPYRETPEQREERHQKRHEEAIELANQISSGNNADSPVTETGFTNDSPADEIIPSTTVRRSDGVSSLDGWDCETGISSLDDSNEIIAEDIDRPFKCMFARESKIKSGQRAAIILMEDLLINGILVPKNTHLMAFCNISSRLEMTVSNIEINGRIIPLGYEAYDNDGSPGIYCPDVGTAGQTVKNRGTRIIGSGLTGKVGRTAGEIISTGVSLIQNSTGEKTVTVPAGYTFYIVKKKQ